MIEFWNGLKPLHKLFLICLAIVIPGLPIAQALGG